MADNHDDRQLRMACLHLVQDLCGPEYSGDVLRLAKSYYAWVTGTEAMALSTDEMLEKLRNTSYPPDAAAGETAAPSLPIMEHQFGKSLGPDDFDRRCGGLQPAKEQTSPLPSGDESYTAEARWPGDPWADKK